MTSVDVDVCRDNLQQGIICYDRGTTNKVAANWESGVLQDSGPSTFSEVELDLSYVSPINNIKVTANDRRLLDGGFDAAGKAAYNAMKPVSSVGDFAIMEALPEFAVKLADTTQKDCLMQQSDEYFNGPKVFTCDGSRYVGGLSGGPACAPSSICTQWESVTTNWTETCVADHTPYAATCLKTFDLRVVDCSGGVYSCVPTDVAGCTVSRVECLAPGSGSTAACFSSFKVHYYCPSIITSSTCSN